MDEKSSSKSQNPRSRYERWKITKLNYENGGFNKLCPINNKKIIRKISSEKNNSCDPKPLKSGSIFIIKCAYQGVKVF